MILTLEQQEADNHFLHAIVQREVREPSLNSLCHLVITDPEFKRRPGGSKHHHNYEAGLQRHTVEVAHTCLKMANPQHLDLQVLTVAAVIHDYHKIAEYQMPDEEGKVEVIKAFRDTLGHLASGALWFAELARNLRVPQDVFHHIHHCVLAHHGRREWGSPVEPATKEAWILHAADMLSSRGQL